MVLFLRSLLFSIGLYVCFGSSSLLFWYRSLLVQFEVSVMPPALLFLFMIFLGVWGILRFHMTFKIVLSNSVKNVNGILMDIALNL